MSLKVILVLFASPPLLGWALIASTEANEKAATTTFLTSDAHVVVGDTPVRLPIAFLPDYNTSYESSYCSHGGSRGSQCDRLQRFQLAADRPETAPEVDVLEVSVHMGGWRDFNEVSSDFCQRFSAEWAQSVCENPWMPLKQALPFPRFYLIDDRTLSASTAMQHLGPLGEDVSSITISEEKTSLVCNTRSSGHENTSCTAAMRLRDHLVAFWAVSETVEEPPAEVAGRQGATIKLFIDHVSGREGNFADLLTTACELRAPDLPASPDRWNSCLMTAE